MRETRGVVRGVIGAALGGAWGGAIVGLAEAGLIAATSAPGDEYWMFPYAIVSYGLFGLLIGVGYAVLAAVGIRWFPRLLSEAFGVGAGLAFFLLGIVVGRYHVALRVFHEELVTMSPTGIAVHIGLVILFAVLAWMLMRAGRLVQHQRRGLTIGAAGLMACIAISVAASAWASAQGPVAALARPTGPQAQGHPNVILIITDTLRADALGSFGASPNASPALDVFAGESVRFANAYSQSTWTRPSVATILTSLYPSVHGAIGKFDALPDRVTTLAEALRAQGYWTAGFVSNINVAPVFNYQQGFDEYTYLAPDFYFWASDSATRLAIYKGLRAARERFFRDRIYFSNYYQDAEIVGNAVNHWLDQRPPSPFFLFIHYMDPHDPYFEIPYNGHGIARVTNPDPPPAHKGEMQQLYAEDVTYLDHHLGGLFARLKALGLYDTSIIALTADHGEEFQDHGGWWHGTTLYQEVMHVPVIIKRAHEPQPGRVESSIARTLDLAPTLMAEAGLPPSSTFEGHDLFEPPSGEAEPLFAEEDLEGNVLAAVRIGSWKLITANADNPRGLKPVELYDLSQDADEHHDRAAEEPARAEEMLRLLATERARILQWPG